LLNIVEMKFVGVSWRRDESLRSDYVTE